MKLCIVGITVLVAFAVTANGYCDYKSHAIHTGLSKAILQANRWLLEAQDDEGKWLDAHTTGYALTVLKLIGYDLDEENTCSKTFQKAAKYLKGVKGDIKEAHGSELAQIIMGLNALCEDPSDYQGMNLTDNLLQDVNNFPKGKFNHYFQYSLALMTLGINDVRVEWSAVERILNKVEMILRTGEKHTKDTCALFVMALQSVVHQFHDKEYQLKWINKIITKLSNTLAMKTKAGVDNHVTIALVMQAQTAVGKDLDWKETKCEKTFRYIINQKAKDGSFGGLGSTLHVLPALAGVSFLSLKNNASCHYDEKKKPIPGNIFVSIDIEFKATEKVGPGLQILQIVNGSTVLDALRAAAAEDDCYQFETRTTAWGESLVRLCRNHIVHNKKIYWFYYVNGKMPNKGVDSYVLEDGDFVTFKYQKLSS